MPTTVFDASLRTAGDAAIVDLCGDVTADAKPLLDAAYEHAVSGGCDRLLLNFTEVGYINSTGIAVIVAVLARARAEDRPVRAYGLSDHYREIFAITRLADFMPLYADETTAASAADPISA